MQWRDANCATAAPGHVGALSTSSCLPSVPPNAVLLPHLHGAAWGSRRGQPSRQARGMQPASAGFEGCGPQSGTLICLKAAYPDSPPCALTLPHSGYHPTAPSRSGGGRYMAGSTSACMECRETINADSAASAEAGLKCRRGVLLPTSGMITLCRSGLVTHHKAPMALPECMVLLGATDATCVVGSPVVPAALLAAVQLWRSVQSTSLHCCRWHQTEQSASRAVVVPAEAQPVSALYCSRVMAAALRAEDSHAGWTHKQTTITTDIS